MKKQNIFLLSISLLILALFLIQLVYSEDNPIPPGTPAPLVGGEIDSDTGLPKEVIPVKNIGDVISDEDKRTAYLKAEWEKILLKSETFGPIVKFILTLDPVSNILLGIPISFSWFFFLTLVIWIAFLIIFYRVTSLFEIQNKWIHIIVYLIAVAVITFYKYPKSIAEVIIGIIALMKIWWMQYVIIGIVILIIILAAYFSKQLQIIWKALKEKNKKDMEEMDRKRLKRDLNVADTLREGLSSI